MRCMYSPTIIIILIPITILLIPLILIIISLLILFPYQFLLVSGFKSMPIAASAVYISPIAYTPRMNCHQNSNYSSPSHSRTMWGVRTCRLRVNFILFNLKYFILINLISIYFNLFTMRDGI